MNKPNVLQIIFAIGIVLAILTGGDAWEIWLMVIGFLLVDL